jgi:hypothetical protein
MNEPTMIEAATPTNGATSNPESVAATADKLYGEQEASTPQTPKAEEAKGSVTGDTQGTTEAESESSEVKEEAKGAPEKYEFKAPEGKEFDADVLTAYSKVAKELNLTQDAAQKLLDQMGPVMAQRQSDQIQAVRKSWTEASTADKEFGGEKLSENLGTARKALDMFGTAELRNLLNESGLGSHPEVIRFMYRAGKAISEDRFVGGAAGSPPKGLPKSFAEAADALYSTNT